jgi:hypothetical protein
MGKMVSLMLVKIKSEYSREVEQTMTRRVEEEIKQSEIVIQRDKQNVAASTGNVDVAGIEFYSSPSGTVYARVAKADLINFYSYKIKSFFIFADTEFERAKAYAEQGDTKSALDRVGPVKDTLENNVDSWVMILHIAGGRGSEAASLKKKELLLLADNLNRANAAKDLAERLRKMAADIEFSAKAAIDEKHPKRRSEAWQKTQAIWKDFAPLQIAIEGMDKEKAEAFKPVKDLYARARDEYLSYCKSAKLYWKEQDDVYSNIAFSKIFKNLEVEKKKTFEGKTCKGHGILLVYKNTGHECKYAGMFMCSHKPAIRISSCQDEEYASLDNPQVEAVQREEKIALARLHEKLEYESFWSGWEQEIKPWRPVCE